MWPDTRRIGRRKGGGKAIIEKKGQTEGNGKIGRSWEGEVIGQNQKTTQKTSGQKL